MSTNGTKNWNHPLTFLLFYLCSELQTQNSEEEGDEETEQSEDESNKKDEGSTPGKQAEKVINGTNPQSSNSGRTNLRYSKRVKEGMFKRNRTLIVNEYS